MRHHSVSRAVPPLLLALSSAALLILAFPSFDQPGWAWIALVPWLALLRTHRGRAAFGWSWIVGCLFFLGSMWWMVHLTAFGGPLAIAGWVVLSAYLGVYFGAFGWFVARLHGPALDQRPETRDQRSVSGLLAPVSSLIVVPAAWVALEFLRSHLLSGFGWNLLAYSQAAAGWTPITRVASVTGVWGLSFLIVLANALFARGWQVRRTRRAWRLVLGGAAIPALLWVSGLEIAPPVAEPHAVVAVAQGNIPQEQKWDETYAARIQDTYQRLTRQAAAFDPDLIVWPETAVPGYFGVEEEVTRPVLELARETGRPLLVGAPAARWTLAGLRMTNRASLIAPDGTIAQTYDKLRLVAFGEFVPGERRWPWLRRILPPIGEFVPGEDATMFKIGGHGAGGTGQEDVTSDSPAPRAPRPAPLTFGVLICFEDTFPGLARTLVRRGAQFLVVITNDAWFGPTAAAIQHAQASALRAVELGVPVVRAANTGWSGSITPHGQWGEAVHDATGRTLFVEGVAVCGITPGRGDTPYVRWGDWLPWLCVAGTLASGVFPRRDRARRKA